MWPRAVAATSTTPIFTPTSAAKPTTRVCGADVHVLRRGTKYAAAHYFRMILANDGRPRTMHAEAERADRERSPTSSAGCSTATTPAAPHARQTWREHTAAQRAFYERYERLAADIGRTAERAMGRGYGLEL